MGTSRKISLLSSRSRRIRGRKDGPRDEIGDNQEGGAAESSCSDFAAVSALMEMVEQPASKRKKRKAKSPPSTPAGEKAGCMDCGASYSPIWPLNWTSDFLAFSTSFRRNFSIGVSSVSSGRENRDLPRRPHRKESCDERRERRERERAFLISRYSLSWLRFTLCANVLIRRKSGHFLRRGRQLFEIFDYGITLRMGPMKKAFISPRYQSGVDLS